MASRSGRRRVIAAVMALTVIVAALVIGMSLAGHSPSRSSATGTVPDAAPSATNTTTPKTASRNTTPTTAALSPTAPPASAGAAPAPADVAAARACQAFTVYLEDAQRGEVPAAAGRALIEDAADLLRGSQSDQAAGRALPRWASLGSDLLAAAEDVVAKKTDALETDGAAAGAQCRTVPAAAASAGGYNRLG